MKKNLFVVMIVLIALMMTSCFESTSSDPKLNQPTEFVIAQQTLTQLALAWTDNSKKEDGYKIERKFDDEDWQEIADLDENANNYMDDISTVRANWETVYYQVYSYEGNDTSLPAEGNASLAFPAPSDLVAMYSNDVLLSWYDNSDGEEGFYIERKVNNGDYEVIAIDFANSEFYVDENVELNNVYFYRIQAFAGSFTSAYSNEYSVSTQTNPLEADFIADVTSGFAPLTVNFTDLSAGDAISWEWSFGNGDTSTEQNPTNILYDTEGYYTVSLTVYDGITQSTETKDDYIHVLASGTLVELSQHDGNPQNGYYQAYNNGYGVVYDLSGYTGVTLEMLDFRHSSWGLYGTWDYSIHVVDWDTYSEITEIGGLQTTDDDTWEVGIDLGSVSESGYVGIFMEPMSNSSSDAYPCLDSDDVGPDGMSYHGLLSDYSSMVLSDIGDFLMDLWIMADGTDGVVKAQRITAKFGEGNARLESETPTFESFIPKQTENKE